MEYASSTAFSFALQRSSSAIAAAAALPWWRRRPSVRVSALSYRQFVQFALAPHSHGSFSSAGPLADKTETELLPYEVPKIRLLRSLSIQGSKGLQYSMQVLHFAVFPEPEYDLPIFYANFFTAAETIIVVLDLNLLYDVVKHKEYKDKCYEGLMSLGLEYGDLLPWGGNLTGELLRFFSPIVIWTRFKSSQHMHAMDLGIRETDASQIIANHEAQHRYLTSRAEKFYHLNEVQSFLFDGVDSLGCKTFLDYFPEYPCEEGRVNEKHAREVFCNSPVEQERRIYRKL
ncbi:hypothetical protein ACJRO7_026479 [Eucalyptus globulus]|uniref:Uncharacterized protein n=1 Tax=Eucalyptus globulus TaxID=34317 RepID=A0ABD3JP59_EUCGL